MTAAHRIVVWTARDDRELLNAGRFAVEAGRNPRVVEWRPEMGPCISFDLWQSIGRPVHGVLAPDARLRP